MLTWAQPHDWNTKNAVDEFQAFAAHTCLEIVLTC